MARHNNIQNDDNQQDSTEILKLLGRTLSQLSALERKIENQEELLFELRKNQNIQASPKSFEPIRGIYGLAEFLGVSPVTAQKLKNSGKIPFAQFERLVLFDPQKVLDALEMNSKPKKR
ncbi:MAG: DUF3853 family protein [Bacteroidales bacterium]|nr:DUF3853 family protein [Bacteroidales bacterium]